MKKIKAIFYPGMFVLFVLQCASHLEVLRPGEPNSQDPNEYVFAQNLKRPLISSAYQDSLNKQYQQFYFKPWSRGQSAPSDPHLFWAIPFIQKAEGFGENKLPHSECWKEKVIQNADTGNVGDKIWLGVNTGRTFLRALPTNRPFFLNFNRAGEGYPFDYLQNSALPLNTPVRVIHQSRDKAWLLIESHHSSGWAPTEQICAVTEEQRNLWMLSKQVALIREPVSVTDTLGRFIAQARTGEFFPFIDSTATHWRVGIMIRDENGQGVIRTGQIPRNDAVLKPWLLNYEHTLQLAETFLNQPYGWGGWLNNRDCSAMIKDFFTPFGIWLPRHSTAQVDFCPYQTGLYNLNTRDKEFIITHQGMPYLCLLWKPGHIMLYAGQNEKHRPMILHNLWGLKTKPRFGKEGRAIIGRGVLSTLEPEKDWDIPHVPASLADQIGKMAWVVNPDSILVSNPGKTRQAGEN